MVNQAKAAAIGKAMEGTKKAPPKMPPHVSEFVKAQASRGKPRPPKMPNLADLAGKIKPSADPKKDQLLAAERMQKLREKKQEAWGRGGRKPSAAGFLQAKTPPEVPFGQPLTPEARAKLMEDRKNRKSFGGIWSRPEHQASWERAAAAGKRPPGKRPPNSYKPSQNPKKDIEAAQERMEKRMAKANARRQRKGMPKLDEEQMRRMAARRQEQAEKTDKRLAYFDPANRPPEIPIPRSPEEIAEEAKMIQSLAEVQKTRSEKSWAMTNDELEAKLQNHAKKQEVLLSDDGQRVLQGVLGPPMNPMGYVRIGMFRKPSFDALLAFLQRNRDRAVDESFSPIFGTSRPKFIPLPAEWSQQDGLLHKILKPYLAKFQREPMEPLKGSAKIRIYEPGQIVTEHLDSVEKKITVTVVLEASGAGETWGLNFSSAHADLVKSKWKLPPADPSQKMKPGHLLLYEGSRVAHGRIGSLASGQLAVFLMQFRAAGGEKSQEQHADVQSQINSFLLSSGYEPLPGEQMEFLEDGLDVVQPEL